MIISIYSITTVAYEIRQYSTNIHTIRFTLKQEEQRPRIYDYTKRTIRCVAVTTTRLHISSNTKNHISLGPRCKGRQRAEFNWTEVDKPKKHLGSNLTMYSLALVVAVTQLEIVGIVVVVQPRWLTIRMWMTYVCVCACATILSHCVCKHITHVSYVCEFRPTRR